jgi:GPI inositol-deacylase, winged helix domain
MEILYTTILSRIEKDDRKWVKEIIRWLVVAKRLLSVGELKDVVEWCLQDKLVDFRNFVELDCGSILQLIPSSDGKDDPGVQLIHETFRSFVLNSENLPQLFLINEVDGHVALNCLRHLMGVGEADAINSYSLGNWVTVEVHVCPTVRGDFGPTSPILHV